DPGTPITWASARRRSKKSHEDTPAGVRIQMYGALRPPYTVRPAASRPARMMRAFSMENARIIRAGRGADGPSADGGGHAPSHVRRVDFRPGRRTRGLIR